MSTKRFRRCRGERGAAAVEFALTVPIVILLLVGTITTGLVYSDHLGITNAVREAARYGAAADATDPTLWADSVQQRVRQVYFNSSGTAPTNNQICAKLVTSTGTVVASDPGTECGTQPGLPSNMAAGSCAVLVWASKPETIKLVVAPDLNLQIAAESVAYYGLTLGTTCTAK